MSRREKSGRVTSNGREPRHARMEIRYGRYLLPPTKDTTQDPMPVWGIHMRKESPPADNDPIEWYLLTTQEITSVEQTEDTVNTYKLRWRIEDHFRVLKTGCKVENLRLQDAESLHRVITLYMVSAWRIMLMTLLGRETVDLSAEVFFTESEFKMMDVYAQIYKVPAHTDLKSAILLVAMMGGYMDRKNDPPPGHEIMWRGYAKLQMRAITYEELKGIYDLVERTSLPSIAS
ncbi:MAG: IS4 family transposase [Bacteroidetes bacterium]|nr:IS4 family transposase [Bacteroidota bacterium]